MCEELPYKKIVLSGVSLYHRVEGEDSGERVFAHTQESEEADTSDSEQQILCSGEDNHDSERRYNAYRSLAGAQEDEHDEESLVPFLRAAGFEVPVEDEYRMSADHRLLCSHYAKSLNARRAKLLQFFPGALILVPISEPLCQLLDIGRPNAWLFMDKLLALMRMYLLSHLQVVSGASLCYLRAKLTLCRPTHVQLLSTCPRHEFRVWTQVILHSNEELFYQFGMGGTGKHDLIHMQDWAIAMNFLPSFLRELFGERRPWRLFQEAFASGAKVGRGSC